MSQFMNIGQAATAAGVSAKMIRHYEQIGLMPVASRTDSGYRLYSAREVSVLRFIRQSRRLGFSIKQIADLIGMWGDDQRSSRDVKAVALAHLADLDGKMREIAAMKEGLEQIVATCRGDDDPHCAILEQLAVDSPAAPAFAPGPITPAHTARSRSAARRSKPSPVLGSGSSHVDLMAWTRQQPIQHADH